MEALFQKVLKDQLQASVNYYSGISASSSMVAIKPTCMMEVYKSKDCLREQ